MRRLTTPQATFVFWRHWLAGPVVMTYVDQSWCSRRFVCAGALRPALYTSSVLIGIYWIRSSAS